MKGQLLRFVPRYSLRTLAVFMLLCTSGFGLWWRWEPWCFVRALDTPDSIPPVAYEFDDHRALFELLERGRVSNFGNLSPDGAVIERNRGEVLLRRASTGDIEWKAAWRPKLSQAYFSPDGGFVAFEYHDTFVNTVTMRRAATGERLWQCRLGSRSGPDTAFSPDGRLVAFTGKTWDNETITIEVRLAETGEPVMSWCSPGWAWPMAISPDGALLACGSGNREVSVLDVATGTCVRTLAGGCISIEWSPDGRTLLTAGHSDSSAIWDVGSGTCIARLGDDLTADVCGAYSRSGDRVATGNQDHHVRIWSARTGQCLYVLKAQDRAVRSLAFSSDGERLLVWDGFLGIWQRHRPEWWWGVFWLREFWLTAAFAAIFVWSVVRDRRRLARTG